MLTTKQLIIQCGKTKAQLAAATGISRAAVTRYSQGREPEVPIAAKIAEVTGSNIVIRNGRIMYEVKK